jgi:cell division protease FtsH
MVKMSLLKNYKPVEIIKNVAQKGIESEWSYNDFLYNLKEHKIDAATITDTNNLVVIDNQYNDVIKAENLHLLKGVPQLTDNIVNKLIENGINFDIYNVNENKDFLSNIPFGIQFVLFYLLGSFVLNFIQRSGMMNNMMSNIPNLNKNGKIIDSKDIDVKFSDVAGCEESKYELMEIVEFLKDPTKFKDSGAVIPSGVLLEGPPGTGKTLLARAVAGEAGVGFISASGSEFIEMFVGVGASRVRNLFKQAEENKPCVIFIDEIDAIGRQRGTGFNSGNDEREQTLNQILTNMDGFDKNKGIIVLAATNRADILDSALTRPGRFDRKVTVSLPDAQGRKAIFGIHLKNKKYIEDLDLEQFSQLTQGFSGADISNMVNEAAILSLRSNKTEIDNLSLYNAFEKVTIGLPKANDNRLKSTIELVAYHEAGHTVVAKLFNDIFDVRKVTINANSNGAGGYTLFTQKEKYAGFPTKKLLLAQLMVSLGGRVAEMILYSEQSEMPSNYIDSIVFDGINNLDITTGASNDLKQADNIARSYINLFGFNDTLATFEDSNPNQPFLGRDIAMNNNKISEYSKNRVDKEVNRLTNFAYKKTLEILNKNKEQLKNVADLLISNISIDQRDLNKIEVDFF